MPGASPDRPTLMRRSGDTIADELAERIVEGRWPVGGRLPAERRLAEEFGASRPVVREALRSLVERGLVEVYPGRGTFVRGPGTPPSYPPIDFHFRRSGVTARQLSEARIMLETEAAGLAAERATDADIDRLRGSLTRLDHAGSPIEHVRADLSFHLALAGAAHNPVIETMFRSIAGLAVELMVRSAADPEVLARSAPFHRRALEAVEGRDPDAARAALWAHLSVAGETYGEDYDRSLGATAFQALRLIGPARDLDSFVRSVVPGAGSPTDPGAPVR